MNKSQLPASPSHSTLPDPHVEAADYESVIERGLETFVEVGTALAVIRDERLYKEEFSTFEEYLSGRWQMSRRSAYQFINASEVVEDVRNCAQIEPKNEAQCRPLTSLPREERADAWKEAVETAQNGKVTAQSPPASTPVSTMPVDPMASYVFAERVRCPFCHLSNYKTQRSQKQGDGTTMRRCKCLECEKNFVLIIE